MSRSRISGYGEDEDGGYYSDSSEEMTPRVTISFTAPATVKVLPEAYEALEEADAADADEAAAEEDGGAEVVAINELAVEDGGAEEVVAEDDAMEELVVVEATTAEDATADDVALQLKQNEAEEVVAVAFVEDGGTVVPASFIASMYTGLHWAPCETS